MEKIINFTKKYWFNIIIGLIVLFGIFIRLHVYLINRSLWLDEAALANNLLLPRTILNNMQYQQAAPPLFKLISLINIKLFGINEYALRLFPLFCGIASIFLFIEVIKKLLPSKLTQIIATTMFSVNWLLIYYSSEFKQYSTDVCCSLGLIFLALKTNITALTKKQFIILSTIFASVFWLSHASLFILLSIFLYYLIFNYKEFKRIFALFTPALISFIVFWFVHLKTISSSSFMHEYWVSYFINTKENINTVINDTIPMFFYPNLSIFLLLAGIVIGIILLIKSNLQKSTLILMPTIILLILSFLNIYPFAYRLVLFLVPLNIIYYTGLLLPKKHKISTVLAILLFLSGIFRYINYYPQVILKKDLWLRDELRTLYEYIDKHIKPDDIILSTNDIYQQNKFYIRKFKFKNKIIEQRKNLPIPFDKMEPHKKYMVICNQYFDKNLQLRIVQYLTQNTKILSQYEYYQNYVFYVEKLP